MNLRKKVNKIGQNIDEIISIIFMISGKKPKLFNVDVCIPRIRNDKQIVI